MDENLIGRVREIIEWQNTGILKGNLLNEMADRDFSSFYDPHQQAERHTIKQALRLLVDIYDKG